MLDYPKNQIDFEKQFSSETQCRKYLFELRFGPGWVCERCGSKEHWRQSRERLTCVGCRHEISPTRGTVFHGSHLPLMVWFRAAWWITNQKQGISALGLQSNTINTNPKSNKHMVMIAAEKIAKKIGRIRMKLVHESGIFELMAGVEEMGGPGRLVEADGGDAG